MRRRVILDTGPLAAFLNSRDRLHPWAVAQWALIEPPFLTCEAVISEACFLLRKCNNGAGPIFELLNRNILEISFRLADHIAPVSALLKKYAGARISMADACLARMAELHDDSSIITFDAGFRIFRKHKRQVIPLLMPAVV